MCLNYGPERFTEKVYHYYNASCSAAGVYSAMIIDQCILYPVWCTPDYFTSGPESGGLCLPRARDRF